jgi:hypothetical protein
MCSKTPGQGRGPRRNIQRSLGRAIDNRTTPRKGSHQASTGGADGQQFGGYLVPSDAPGFGIDLKDAWLVPAYRG